MEQLIEKEVALPGVSMQLASVRWGIVQEFSHACYYVCQRLSDDHPPLRIGNLPISEAFPRARSVGFLPPNCSVQIHPIVQPFRVVNCSFDAAHFEEITQIGSKEWLEHAGELVLLKSSRLETLMQEIHAELMQPGFAYELHLEAVATMILVELARYARSNERGNGPALSSWQMRCIQERIKASLEVGYPSLEELARLCHISQSHLMRSFKAATGWPIHKYIAVERLNAAKGMLAKDELKTKEISVRLGFRSPAYFSTAFRRMTGKTPSEYRKDALASLASERPRGRLQ